MENASTEQEYIQVIGECFRLMLAKDDDYGEAWKEMRLTSITDQILVKVRRIKHIEVLNDGGVGPKVSEGIESEYRDILNWSVFALIKIRMRGRQ